MKTMTLNLPDREMQALEKLAEHQELSKTQLMRCALRLYQSIHLHLQRGGTMRFDGELPLIALPGFGEAEGVSHDT